ncbi:hypothetical protein JCM17961_00780 [Endothiovibrio diazotrophicus]
MTAQAAPVKATASIETIGDGKNSGSAAAATVAAAAGQKVNTPRPSLFG